MKSSKSKSIILIILVLTACASGERDVVRIDISGLQQNDFGTIQYDKSASGQELDGIIDLFEAEFAHSERKHIDYPQLKDKYSLLVAQVSNRNQYLRLLLQLFSEFKNNHTGLLNIQKICHNARAVRIGNEVRIQESGDARLPVGERLVRIDGIEIEEWLESRIIFNGSSTAQFTDLRNISDIFERYEFENKDKIYTLEKADSGIYDVEITLDKSRFLPDLPPIVFSRYTDYSYLAINTMTDGVYEEFLKILPQLENTGKIILDLRNNRGGNSANSEKLLSHFLRKPVIASVSRRTVQPSSINLSDKNIILLTGSRTFSAAESFVIDMLAEGLYKMIGEPTAGDTGFGPVYYRTKSNLIFRMPTRKNNYFSPSGIEMEGKGIVPHITVVQTIDDFLQGRDSVLEYAVHYLLN